MPKQTKHKIPERIKNWSWRHRRPLALIVLNLLILAVISWLMVWQYQNKHRQDQTTYGVSYSLKYAEELGIDWMDGLNALLDDMNVKNFRLMSYWDQIEPEDGEFDFKDLDYQMDAIAKRGGQVTLASGERQPRWPECHVPSWTDELEDREYEEELIEYLQTLYRRYDNHPALASYQLENEAANRLFGECERPFDGAKLQREFDAVKAITNKDVVINASNQSGVPVRHPVGDQVGFSIYKHANFPALGRDWTWSFWYVPNWWHTLRASWVEFLHDKPSFIHELQAEPWGPQETVKLSVEEQNKTMDAAKLRDITGFAEQTGMNDIYLWGGEWWYWRLVEFDDPSLWDEAKRLFD